MAKRYRSERQIVKAIELILAGFATKRTLCLLDVQEKVSARLYVDISARSSFTPAQREQS